MDKQPRPEVETMLDKDPVTELSEELTDTQRRLKAAIVKGVMDGIRNDRKSFIKTLQNALKFFFSDIEKH